MQAADGLDVQCGGLFQHGLHLHAVFADDADEVAAGLGQPRLLHVECAELAERIGAEQDLVCIVIGHDDLGPVDHRRGDKVQRVGAQRQGVPLLDDDAAVRVVGAEIGLHHVERLGGRDDGCAGVRLRERGDGAGMVRLHVLHDQVVGRALAQCGGDLGDPLVGKMGIDAVHDGDLVVADQVRVVRHAVGHIVLALKQVNKVVVDADIQNIFGDFHTCKPPEKYQSCYSGHSIA